ncbi:MAG: N-acetylneuraminate synthase [Spirochaetes bacterium]|nr:MAG: N-acetylneuraminate synthase [Spirochaetota bacterium]
MSLASDVFKGRETVFIAEIGLNHNGDPETAALMIDAAAASGAHAVKFQTFVPELFYSRYTSSLLATGSEGAPDGSQIEFFRKFVLREADYRLLKARALERGLVFFSSPFDAPSVELLESIGVPLYKVASSEVTNHPLLRRIAKTGKPVIMSTGICTQDEIASALGVLRESGAPDIVLLHCVSLYPLPRDKANLARIPALGKRFGVRVGFSDHTADERTAEIAAAFGARIFEKHFMHQPRFECPDSAVSLDPAGFRRMVEGVREAIAMAGDGHLSSDFSEKEIANSARRSVFSSRFIGKGSLITRDDLVAKRPGTGMPAYRIDEIAGRKAACDIDEDHLIRAEYLE